jgi:RNA polymerase sigma-70 factor (ECF subfamily)
MTTTEIPEAPSPTSRTVTKESVEPLVTAAKTGDRDAVRELLQVLEPVMVRYCRMRMGGRDLSYLSADDVAQEVCIALVKILPSYEERGGSFLHLGLAIAANKVADAFRAVARDRSQPVPDPPETRSAPNEPESHALRSELALRLDRLMSALPPTHREVLTLRFGAGLSATETGAALGISPGNVRARHHRAIVRLRAMVEPDDFWTAAGH